VTSGGALSFVHQWVSASSPILHGYAALRLVELRIGAAQTWVGVLAFSIHKEITNGLRSIDKSRCCSVWQKVTLLKIRYIRKLGKEGYEFVDVQCFISLFLYYPIPIYTRLFKGSLEALENL